MKPATRPSIRFLGATAALLALAGAAIAQDAGPEIFRGADVALGTKLITENRCAECHARRVGGDGSAIYRPGARIDTPVKLRSMVEYCATELKLNLFPEEVTAMAAALNRDHYHFKQ